jgi:hypothetical protein
MYPLTGEYIVTIVSCSHAYDFPTGVANKNVFFNGVANFTSKFGRSICSNNEFDDEYDKSMLLMYHRSPPGVLAKSILSVNPFQAIVINESSSFSQLPPSTG